MRNRWGVDIEVERVNQEVTTQISKGDHAMCGPYFTMFVISAWPPPAVCLKEASMSTAPIR